MQTPLIFNDKSEDFVKIFLATLLVFALMQLPGITSAPFFIILTVYLLDGGHVYSTLLEVLFDPEEVKKRYVALVLLGSFFLNLSIHYFFHPYFFYYVFYFTVFHNMRQGLGITFLYRVGDNRNPTFIKSFYYFLTMTPFLIFHLRGPLLERSLSGEILMPFYLNQYLSPLLQSMVSKTFPMIYFLVSFALFLILVIQKNTRGILSMLFFGGVYAYSFLFSTHELESYVLLIFSHAIPYYFLMEKRVKLTHQKIMVKKYAWIFLISLFIIGGTIDYFQDDLVGLFEPFESLIMALLLTPLISHFIFDAIIWKRGNARFKMFIQSQKVRRY